MSESNSPVDVAAAPRRVLVERVGAIRIIKLNRPEKLNAADLALQQQVLEAIEAVAADAEARALVLTGNGRAFCSGGDRSLAEAAGEGRLPHKEELGRIQLGTIRGMLGLDIRPSAMARAWRPCATWSSWARGLFFPIPTCATA